MKKVPRSRNGKSNWNELNTKSTRIGNIISEEIVFEIIFSILEKDI